MICKIALCLSTGTILNMSIERPYSIRWKSAKNDAPTHFQNKSAWDNFLDVICKQDCLPQPLASLEVIGGIDYLFKPLASLEFIGWQDFFSLSLRSSLSVSVLWLPLERQMFFESDDIYIKSLARLLCLSRGTILNMSNERPYSIRWNKQRMTRRIDAHWNPKWAEQSDANEPVAAQTTPDTSDFNLFFFIIFAKL